MRQVARGGCRALPGRLTRFGTTALLILVVGLFSCGILVDDYEWPSSRLQRIVRSNRGLTFRRF